MEALSKEEFIKKHGFDPETDENAKSALPSLGNAARDIAVGAATAIPSVIALPATIGHGLSAAQEHFTSKDPTSTFGKQFSKAIFIDDADAQIKARLTYEADKYKEKVGAATDDEVRSYLEGFTNSDEFKSFRRGLMRSASLQFNDRVLEFARNMVGDYRTEEQRSWVDSALEAVGGAAVGIGPGTAAKIGTKIGSSAIGAKLMQNPISYGALRTAEALTPVTLPLTPGNFTLNAAVGAIVDQGARYATGQTSVFDQDDHAISGLAAVAGATAAGATALAIFRGRAAQAVQLPPTTPAIKAAMEPAEKGGAALVAGKELNEFANIPPQPALAGGSIFKQARDVATKSTNLLLDETQAARTLIGDLHGPNMVKEFDATFSNFTGAGGRDTAKAKAEALTHDYQVLLNQLSEEEYTRYVAADVAKNVVDRRTETINDYAARLAEHARKQQANAKDYNATLHAEEQAALARFQADDPLTRRYVPALSSNEVSALATDLTTNPKFAELQRVKRIALDELANQAVATGMLRRSDATALRTKYADYSPLVQDVHEGKTGMWRALDYFKKQLGKPVEEGYSANRPFLHSLNRDIITRAEDPRVTRPGDTAQAFLRYVEDSYTRMYHNTARDRIISALEKDSTGQSSKYMTNNNMQKLEINNRTEFSPDELRAAATGKVGALGPLFKALNDDNIIRVQRKGMTSFYEFGDPQVTAMLRFEPTLFHGVAFVAKKTADLYKFGTTGAGAPFFAAKNAFYDTTFGMMLRSPSRAFGPLNTQIYRIAGEAWGRRLTGWLPDPTAYPALLWHAAMEVGEITAAKTAQMVADSLATNGPVMSSIAKAVGRPYFDTLVQRMLVATHDTLSMTMLERGVLHSANMNDLYRASDAFSLAAQQVPRKARLAYEFYRNLVSAVHGAPKRQFFAQNYYLLEKKFGVGKIPAEELDKLVYEARSLAGDMTRRPGSKTLQKYEGMVPYTSPMRNGIMYMTRGLIDPQTAGYVWPRLAIMMGGIMSSFYLMSNWDEAASNEFWLNTPAWQKYRYLFVPTPQVLEAFANGEKPAFTPDSVYKMPLGPDLAPIIAGTSAFLRGIGALPNGPDRTAQTGMQDFYKMTVDMIGPLLNLPPLAAGVAASMGVQVDIGGADARGGNPIRLANANPFMKGPQTETFSNLGEMNSVTANVLGAVAGANGTVLARSLDAMMHATKYDQLDVDASNGLARERSNLDFIAGLKAATTTAVEQQVRKLPDIPMLWKGSEQQYVQTPVQNELSMTKQAIASINGMSDAASGDRASAKRQAADGGVVARYLTDDVYKKIAKEIRSWDRNSDFATLKKGYSDLAYQRRALEANYTIPREERMARVNDLIDRMQDNMIQQRAAIAFKEDDIAMRYGPIKPEIAAAPLTFARLDQLMRQGMGY